MQIKQKKTRKTLNRGNIIIWVGLAVIGLTLIGVTGGRYVLNKLSLPQSQPQIQEQEPQDTSQVQKQEPQNTPQEVVDEFYSWYLIQATKGNYKAYLESDLLSAELKEKVQEARFFDAILCAQDIPTAYKIEKAEVNENKATVYIKRGFGPPEEPIDFSKLESIPMELEVVNNKWLITDIICNSE